MTKLRVVKVSVQVVAVADDGENLHELQVSPVVVPWAEWSEWIGSGGLDRAIDHLRQQVEAEPSDDPDAQ